MVVNFDSLPTRVCATIPRASSDYYTPCARTTKIASQIAANPEITYLRSRPRPQDLLLDQTSEEWCKSHAESAGSVVGKESSGVKLMLLPPDRRRHLCHPRGMHSSYFLNEVPRGRVNVAVQPRRLLAVSTTLLLII
jgi:hypothetical protein